MLKGVAFSSEKNLQVQKAEEKEKKHNEMRPTAYFKFGV